MICSYCKRDREAGYKLADYFFCMDCGSESIYSVVASGVGEYVDFSVDVPLENFVVGDTENFSDGDDSGSCESCENYYSCKEGTSEAPDFNAPCGGEFIP